MERVGRAVVGWVKTVGKVVVASVIAAEIGVLDWIGDAACCYGEEVGAEIVTLKLMIDLYHK